MAPSLPISWALYVLFTDWLFGCTTWWLCSPTSASDNLFLYFLYTPPGALHSPTVCYSTGCPPSAFKGAWDPHEYHCGWNYPSTTEIFMAAFRTQRYLAMHSIKAHERPTWACLGSIRDQDVRASRTRPGS